MAAPRSRTRAGSAAAGESPAGAGTDTGAPATEPVEVTGAAAQARPRPRPRTVVRAQTAAAAPAAAPEPAPPPPSRPPTRIVHIDRVHWSRGMKATAAAAVVVMLGLVAALALALLQHGRDQALSDSRASALGAARTFAVDLANYDYSEVDQAFQTVIDHSTGQFRDEFGKAAPDRAAAITRKQASATGKVLDAAVVDLSGDRATVIAFVDQTVVEANPQSTQVARGRLRLTLVRSGGGWLVSKLENL